MDLTKLTPAPWEPFRCGYAHEQGPDAACGLNGRSFDCSYDECHHPVSLNEMVFIALARNAFDVMMRRGWWASLDNPWEPGTSEWIVEGKEFLFDYRDAPRTAWPDPFAALIEADKWYKEHVETPEAYRGLPPLVFDPNAPLKPIRNFTAEYKPEDRDDKATGH